VRDIRTTMDPALACLGSAIAGRRARPLVVGVGVGDDRDYTGKYSDYEGNAITQDRALIVTSALGKLGRAVRLGERFDPTIAERELGYTDRRQLGDGALHKVAAAADYYIVDGITAASRRS